jgi:hypothetical protein
MRLKLCIKFKNLGINIFAISNVLNLPNENIDYSTYTLTNEFVKEVKFMLEELQKNGIDNYSYCFTNVYN